MSITGKLVEGLTLGFVQEVDDSQEEAPPVQTQPHRPIHVGPASTSSAVSPSQAQPAPATNDSDVESEAKKAADVDLGAVLETTPEKFKLFLARRAELIAVLREASTPADKIETVATANAIKATKLTISDVSAAKQSALNALEGIKGGMTEDIARQRDADVTQPTKAIAATELEIQTLQQQIVTIQQQISAKQSSIDPSRRAIAVADDQLARAQKIFDLSCAKVLAALNSMEAAIIGAMKR